MSDEPVWYSPMPIESGEAPYRPSELKGYSVSGSGGLEAQAVFKRSAYMVIAPPDSRPCIVCGFEHGVWTHGCRPVAYSRALGFGPGHRAYEAPESAIPDLLTRGCCGIELGQPMPDPHKHLDFRWQ